MWKSLYGPSLIGTMINWIGVWVIYLIENRISWILTPIAVICTVITVISHIKSKK
jgi:hypothetical protein